MSKIISGINDLKTKYPELIAEWDYEGNAPITPDEVAYSSNKKYKWICPKGHHYESSPNSRTTKHSGCKYCANKAVLKGFNDLAHTNPKIAEEWDYEKNGEDSPEKYTAGSEKKFYWLCPNGHDSYLASIKARSSGKGCPICGRKKAGESKTKTIIKTKGSVRDLYPQLADEWDYEKNTIGPERFPAQSSETVWWICSWCKHSWPAKIAARTRLNSGCPNCNYRNKTSFPEQAIYYYVHKAYSDAQNGFTELFNNNMELDVYIPSCATGIEYDGLYWHGKDRKKKDELKYQLCQQQNIKLIRVRESTENPEAICDKFVIREDCSSDYSLDKAIISVLQMLSADLSNISVDSNRDRNEIRAQYMATLRDNSLLKKFPNIAAEWHTSKNGSITPDMVSAHSQDIFWWICPDCGYEYQKRISDRTGNGSGCNKCSSKKKSEWRQLLNLQSGVNDLATLYPSLLEEWDYELNSNFAPEKLTAGSHEEVAWICKNCGNKWTASIYARTHGSGCPNCGRIKAGESQKLGSIKKYGSLAEAYPRVASQWDYAKNIGVTPTDVSPVDKSKKYNWVCCSCGIKFESNIYNLTHSKYVGCRKCRYRQAGEYRKEHPEESPFYGKHHSDESRAKISAASSGSGNYWYGKTGEESPNYGRKFSEEHKAKISAALKGKKKSEETKTKLSKSKTGKMMGANNPNSKPIIQFNVNGDIIAEYDSIKSAERALGISGKASHIGDVCRGKQKSAYGFFWKYKDTSD